MNKIKKNNEKPITYTNENIEILGKIYVSNNIITEIKFRT